MQMGFPGRFRATSTPQNETGALKDLDHSAAQDARAHARAKHWEYERIRTPFFKDHFGIPPPSPKSSKTLRGPTSATLPSNPANRRETIVSDLDKPIEVTPVPQSDGLMASNSEAPNSVAWPRKRNQRERRLLVAPRISSGSWSPGFFAPHHVLVRVSAKGKATYSGVGC